MESALSPGEPGRFLESLAHTADGVFAVDREQRIVFWNDAAEKQLGWTSAQALGRHCYTLLGGTDETGCRICARNCRAMQAVARKRPHTARDVRVKTRDGGNVWLNVSTIRTPSERGDRITLVHMFRDACRAGDIERALEQLLARLETLSDPLSLRCGPAEAPSDASLTPRETEVLRLLSRGASTRSIADRLFISRATVRNHVHQILVKMNAHSRLEAVALARIDPAVRGH